MEGPCPYPHHRDKAPSFKIKAKGGDVFHCFGCDKTGNIFTLAREIKGCATFSEQVACITGRTWSDWLADVPTTEEAQQKLVADAERALAEQTRLIEEERARWLAVEDSIAGPVYQNLLELLSLEQKERADLQRRGFPLELARALSYRSLPVELDRRLAICSELNKRCSYLVSADHSPLARVPGFFRLPLNTQGGVGGRWCVAGDVWGRRFFRERHAKTGEGWHVRGLLVPVRNEAGFIVQIKMRHPSPPADLPDTLKSAWPPKYMILGSAERDGGATPPVKAHFAGPPDGGNFPGVLWVTEGELKADLAAHLLLARFCGLPGASQCPELALSAAENGNYREIRVAMDVEDKDHVKWAIARLCTEASARGLRVSLAVWDGERDWNNGKTKGIDDLLASRGDYRVVSYDEWWASLTTHTREYVTRRLESK